jgi:glycosyltransferase involved in cell wall biosynthesis
MKLLILTNNSTRASFRLRIEEHLPYLRSEGIDCVVYTMPKRAPDRWRLFKTAPHYDAVLIHRKCLNILDALVFSRHRTKLIFDFDDAIMFSTSRPQSNHTSHYQLFRRTARMMDVMIAGNETLADYARRYCKEVFVLPTGLDTAAYQIRGATKNPSELRLVWIGSESTLKYLEELRPVLEQIGKTHPNVILRIIADKFFDLEQMRVEKCPWSLATQAADLLACDIGLSPLPDNRFTRGKCGFKMLQYFAAGLPVIASPVGVNADFIRESKAGLAASTPSQWTEAIETMIRNIAFYRQSGEQGRAFVQAFDKKHIGKELCRILTAAVSSS